MKKPLISLAIMALAAIGTLGCAHAPPSGDAAKESTVERRPALSPALLEQVAKYQCAQACGTNQTSYCMVAPRDPKLGMALSVLRSKFADASANRITSSEMKMIFGMTDDPCMRSDTVRENGIWTNAGHACVASVKVDVFPGASGVPIRVHFPSELVFTASRQGDLLSLSPRRTSSLLEIQNESIHGDWGGVIQGVSATSQSAMFQLPRGCIKIPF